MIEKLFPWTVKLTFSLSRYKLEQLLGFQKFVKLTDLKKVTFRHCCDYVSDKLLVSISLNRKNLEEIEIDFNAHDVTKNGIVYLMMHSPKLSSIVIKSKLNEWPIASPCSILEAMAYAKKLLTIKFYEPIDLTANSSFSEVSPLDYIIPGTGTYTQMAFHKNKNIRCFASYSNSYLDDTTLKKILRLCPNLKILEIALRKLITDQGILELFKYCPSLTRLNIAGVDVSRVSENYLGSETVKLKSLQVALTKLNDQCLIDIGKLCIDLE